MGTLLLLLLLAVAFTVLYCEVLLTVPKSFVGVRVSITLVCILSVVCLFIPTKLALPVMIIIFSLAFLVASRILLHNNYNTDSHNT